VEDEEWEEVEDEEWEAAEVGAEEFSYTYIEEVIKCPGEMEWDHRRIQRSGDRG
jgi:hypothetical protein